MADLTKDAWEEKGAELFGPDKANWSFHCPQCGNDMSVARARAEFPQLKGRGWAPEAECIGRYIDVPAARMEKTGGGTKPCDWAAYGLFCGPVEVMAGAVPVHVFDFTGRPFTTPAKAEASRG